MRQVVPHECDSSAERLESLTPPSTTCGRALRRKDRRRAKERCLQKLTPRERNISK